MGYLRRFRGKILWAPVGAVVVVGALVAGTMFASAAAPNLPKKTAAQLLAAMRHAKLPPAMTAVISENASLGFPALPDIAGLPSSALSAASWLAGSHTVQIWYSRPRHVRIAVPVSFGETDLRVDGSQVWLWQSQGQIATHIIVAKPAGQVAKPAGQLIPSWRPSQLRVAPLRLHALAKAMKWRVAIHSTRLTSPPATITAVQAITPLQAAQRLLAMVGPTTKVTITGTTVVAGRPAYQLSVEPRSDQSLIGQILIAVDGTSYLPLQVQVIPRGSSSPAFSIGFTTFTPGQPATSNFAFTPPPGAHVHVVKLANLPGGLMGLGGLSGFLPGQFGKLAAPKVAVPKVVVPGAHVQSAGSRVLGSGWLSVVVLPGNPALRLAGALDNVKPSAPASSAYSSKLVINGKAGQLIAMLRTLLNSATRVHGAWGSGRLISTRLVNVLITSKGQVLIGAVTPAVLYADAAKAQ